MSPFKLKFTTILGAGLAVVLALGTVVPTEAAPPPGMRWSDTAGLTSSRHTSPSTAVRPTVNFSRFYSYEPATVTPAVTASTTSNSTTIAIRGPDGVVRTYPVEGPVVQQGAPAFVTVQGSDGVVRTYPVAESQPAVPVVTYPCR